MSKQRFLKFFGVLLLCGFTRHIVLADVPHCPDHLVLLKLAENHDLAAIRRGEEQLTREIDILADQAKNRDVSFIKSVALQLPKEKWSPTALSNLKDGDYVYLVARDGRIALLPRLLIDPQHPNSKAFLGSHDGLAALFKEIYGNSHGGSGEIVAAGELIMRGGRGHVFSNKAGTRRAGPDALDWAKKLFSANGAKIDESTVVADFSKSPLGSHGNDYLFATAEKKIRDNPKWRPLYKEFAELYQKAVDRKINVDQLTDYILDLSETAHYSKMDIMSFWYALEQTLKQPGEGLSYWFAKTMEQKNGDIAANEQQLKLVSKAIQEYLEKK